MTSPVTQRSTRFACVFATPATIVALIALPLVGCGGSGSSNGTGGLGGAGAGGEPGGIGGTGGEPGGIGGTGGLGPVAAGFQIVATDQAPLEGAVVCLADAEQCATTNSEGRAVIDFPRDQRVQYTLSKDGYVPQLYANVTDDDFEEILSHRLLTDEEVASFAMLVGSTWPVDGTGVILVGVSGSPPGVTFALVDPPGNEPCPRDEPWYIDGEGLPSCSLAATSGQATAGVQGGFSEVPPGEHQVEFGGAAMDCMPGRAWPGDAPNRVNVPVRAGHMSFANMDCGEFDE